MVLKKLLFPNVIKPRGVSIELFQNLLLVSSVILNKQKLRFLISLIDIFLQFTKEGFAIFIIDRIQIDVPVENALLELIAQTFELLLVLLLSL